MGVYKLFVVYWYDSKILYYCINLVINVYVLLSVYLGFILKRWLMFLRILKVILIFCCLYVLKMFLDCLMGILLLILLGFSNVYVFYWLIYVLWMMYVGGKVNLLDVIVGVMLNVLGGILVLLRRSFCLSVFWI